MSQGRCQKLRGGKKRQNNTYVSINIEKKWMKVLVFTYIKGNRNQLKIYEL